MDTRPVCRMLCLFTLVPNYTIYVVREAMYVNNLPSNSALVVIPNKATELSG